MGGGACVCVCGQEELKSSSTLGWKKTALGGIRGCVLFCWVLSGGSSRGRMPDQPLRRSASCNRCGFVLRDKRGERSTHDGSDLLPRGHMFRLLRVGLTADAAAAARQRVGARDGVRVLSMGYNRGFGLGKSRKRRKRFCFVCETVFWGGGERLERQAAKVGVQGVRSPLCGGMYI